MEYLPRIMERRFLEARFFQCGCLDTNTFKNRGYIATSQTSTLEMILKSLNHCQRVPRDVVVYTRSRAIARGNWAALTFSGITLLSARSIYGHSFSLYSKESFLLGFSSQLIDLDPTQMFNCTFSFLSYLFIHPTISLPFLFW